MKYRELSHDEVVAVNTLNCCANAILDNLPKLERRLKASQNSRRIGLLKGAAKIIANTAQAVIEESQDPDQRQMILRRMSRLKLQFGMVRKHPEDMVVMSVPDAEILLAPVLEKCDLECPCITLSEDGSRVMNTAMVKGCETRKALKRVGMSEAGLGMECPYQMMTGK